MNTLFAVGLVLAANVLAGLFGLINADIAVAGYIGIVAMTGGLLILTSRPALAPVGYVSRRPIEGISEGILVRAVGGARTRYA